MRFLKLNFSKLKASLRLVVNSTSGIALIFSNRYCKLGLSLILIVSSFLAKESFGVTLRVSSGQGIIYDSEIEQRYRHSSFGLGCAISEMEYSLWSQVRVARVTSKRYNRTQSEGGFGYAGYIPATAWWVGGGGFGKGEQGTLHTSLFWGQASYGLQSRKWLQFAVVGGTRTEFSRDSRVGQVEVSLLQLPDNSKWQAGCFVSVGTHQLPGGGGVLTYQWFGKNWQWKTMLSAGDFPHWFERETLLKYETIDRMEGVGRTMIVIQFSPKLRWENTIEYNRAHEEDSWFVNSGLAYQW
ncbi:MAG: hypothetical protein OEM52_12845 [bacterium]|nr:hypothetical protein [bacterium]